MRLRPLARIGLAIICVAPLGPRAVAQEVSPRTVLVVQWGPEEFPPTPVVNTAIREVLTSDPQRPVDFFTEYLESDLFPAEEAAAALADYIRRKYHGRQIDLVIPVADPALHFVLEHREDLFPDAPIVYSGLAIPEGVSLSAGGGLTAVMRAVAYGQTLELALQLHPSTQQVFVIAKGRDRQTFESVQAALEGFSERVQVTYLQERTVAQLLAAVRALPQRSVVLYIWYVPEEPVDVMASMAVARLVAQASPAPVYGTNDVYIGVGVIGGVVRNTRETAVRMGEMARRILDGTRAADIPIENARLGPIFDWRQMRRWGIDPSRVPPGSEVRFRVATVWESYRAHIIGTVVVIVAQLLLIAGLLRQRAHRQRAEETVRHREATLRGSYERIRRLAGRLINAQEAARAQIARDLHDDVCQQLVGVSIDVTRLERSTGRIQDLHAQFALANLRQRALGVVEGVRQLSHDLHPATLRLVGLAAALQSHCVEVERRYDVQVSFRADGDLTTLSTEVTLCLFRIAQEALRNGAIHGRARRLGVAVVRSGEQIELTIDDDGHGFDLEAARQDGGGLGLVSMEERAHMVGGEVRVLTGCQQGTTVRVHVPAVGERSVETDQVHGGARSFTVGSSHSSAEPL